MSGVEIFGDGCSATSTGSCSRCGAASDACSVAECEQCQCSVRGVSWDEHNRWWSASWREDGERRHKHFLESKYGFEQAKQRAIAHRRKMKERSNMSSGPPAAASERADGGDGDLSQRGAGAAAKKRRRAEPVVEDVSSACGTSSSGRMRKDSSIETDINAAKLER